ncbi:sphingoid long-chain bases kinase 1-like [Hibiscus syriacus]|uniref:sphingoid long-chain bases kinase 1-like n=1 Tax=Hibiscus syriacus TaxID=106335 RepID=UPI001922D34F|nr:sphingoid long-chain bases kinase 1-like [Hibiscus syriacus]
MQHSGSLSSSNCSSVRVPSLSAQSSRWLSLCSQIATHISSITFLEKRIKKHKAFSKHSEGPITDDQTDKSKRKEHRIDIGGGDENSNLLGYAVYSGKPSLDKRKNVPNSNNSSDVE